MQKSKNHRNSQKSTVGRRHKKATLVVAIASIFLLLAVGFIVYNMRSDENELADKAQTLSLYDTVSRIASQLDEGNGEWKDQSFCTVITASGFAEETQYRCEAQYKRSTVVDSKQDVDTYIADQAHMLGNVDDVRAIESTVEDVSFDAVPQQKDAGIVFGSSRFSLLSQKSVDICEISYSLSKGDQMELTQVLRCTAETQDVYFDTVKEV